MLRQIFSITPTITTTKWCFVTCTNTRTRNKSEKYIPIVHLEDLFGIREFMLDKRVIDSNLSEFVLNHLKNEV